VWDLNNPVAVALTAFNSQSSCHSLLIDLSTVDHHLFINVVPIQPPALLQYPSSFLLFYYIVNLTVLLIVSAIAPVAFTRSGSRKGTRTSTYVYITVRGVLSLSPSLSLSLPLPLSPSPSLSYSLLFIYMSTEMEPMRHPGIY
jgi:hypothetical protein